MKENQREKGAYWEQKAGAYLESIGYEILEYNFRCRMGEIDIIARDGDYLVFCEVKYRAGTGKGYPAEAVDLKKTTGNFKMRALLSDEERNYGAALQI